MPRRSWARSQKIVRPYQGSPHMSGRGRIQPEPFGRLTKMPADDVLEEFRVRRRGVIEKVDVVEGNQARGHVPAVIPGVFGIAADVSRRHIVCPEKAVIALRIGISDTLVGKVS